MLYCPDNGLIDDILYLLIVMLSFCKLFGPQDGNPIDRINKYHQYFEIQITDELLRETRSDRSHYIDAEEVMGMFSPKCHSLLPIISDSSTEKSGCEPY